MSKVCNTNLGKKVAYMLLLIKPEGKRLLGGTRRRWMDNIKMDVGKIGGVWTGLFWLTPGTISRDL
jgi:hypothetical protein